MARHPLSQSDTDTSPTGGVSVRSLPLAFLTALRPDQWTKNLIVFAGLIFGQRLFEPSAAWTAVAAFAVFCGLSSAMYLLNDLLDREEDRRHPVKRHRPIAAGQVPVSLAALGVVGIVAASLGAGFWVNTQLGIVATGFVAVLTSYSRFLKHLVILDVLGIAAGFVLRAVGGAVAVDVPISQWLLVCTVLLTLFLGLSKRLHEAVLLGDTAATHRQALADYTPSLLEQLITIVAGATLLSYAVYTTEPATVAKFGTDRLTWTLPFPIYGIFRYLYLIHRHQGGGSPTETLLRDRPLLACVALWAGAIVLIVYRPWSG